MEGLLLVLPAFVDDGKAEVQATGMGPGTEAFAERVLEMIDSSIATLIRAQ